jgi:predicted N-acetyltransferase YhbS
MAVLTSRRGTGIGAALVEAAVRGPAEAGYARMVVATSSADLDNLRFYQRRGFRFERVERDAFGPESGCPDPIVIDDIPLRDRLWLSQDLIGTTVSTEP